MGEERSGFRPAWWLLRVLTQVLLAVIVLAPGGTMCGQEPAAPSIAADAEGAAAADPQPRADWKVLAESLDQWRAGVALLLLVNCAAVLSCIAAARLGRRVQVRRIAGLEATEEAVGRATEMGRACLFVPGIQDLNYIETVAGVNLLGHVSQAAARYEATIIVPTARSLVMTAAKDAMRAAHMAAGRGESYREDNVFYVTDEQFGYVAYVTGWMMRERPAACFYFGKFYAESLILAETGNAVGAMQIAGTTEPAQLPFFVAACDYTLIGEEFLAANAYLSGDPLQLGSLAGQDLGKILAIAVILSGCLIATALIGREPPDWIKFLEAVFS